MNINSTSKKPTYQIAFISMMLCFEVLLIYLNLTIPYLEIILPIIIPFLATCVAIKTNYLFKIVYLLANVAICFLDIQNGFLVFLPNCIIGLIFGSFISKIQLNFLSFFSLIIASFLAELFSTYLLIYLYQIDVFQIYQNLFKISNDNILNFYMIFSFIVSSISSLFIYLFSYEYLNRLKLAKTSIDKPFYLYIFTLISLVLYTLFYFFNLSLCYIFSLICLISNLYYYLTSRKFINLKYLVIEIILNLILSAILICFLLIPNILYKTFGIIIYSLYLNFSYLIMIKYLYKVKPSLQIDLLNKQK